MMLRKDKVWVFFDLQKTVKSEQNYVIWKDLLFLLETNILVVHLGKYIAANF
jgi:hypothetical protein